MNTKQFAVIYNNSQLITDIIDCKKSTFATPINNNVAFFDTREEAISFIKENKLQNPYLKYA